MVRGALAALLNLEGDIEVVAQVARGDEVVPAALSKQPDVALLDIEMPGGDGLHAAQATPQANRGYSVYPHHFPNPNQTPHGCADCV